MDLLLGQLVYASLPETGFTALKSKKVPALIQQHFIERVVSRYWYATNISTSGYRAVYLHQVTPEHTLFGWLYNDGVDDNKGYSYLPNFICYYLEEPLLDFQLEIIFNCLRIGPVALITPHTPFVGLATVVLPDLWSYQPNRLGVTIPRRWRQHSQTALSQGELLNLFVPHHKQEMVIELNEQTYEQQIANLAFYQRHIVEGIHRHPEEPNIVTIGSVAS